ncbi:hypothetical protein PR048_029582 [Dryococelus australis]|uniref:Uncharacterized protein n=1 Tax=Dryococelus australis TaxID=614101 RepID=A0ABQ9GDS2_9NEOP|nr:hypothetical protein PR048_029582 [Dryococelus australis]
MQMPDQSAVPGFKLLPCRIGDGVDIISDILHFTHGDAHLFIAWRDKTVLIIETPGPELNHLEYNYKLHDPVSSLFHKYRTEICSLPFILTILDNGAYAVMTE